MKRLTIVLATVALAAGVLVALSGVASARETEPYAAEQAKLPPLPAEVKERKRWNIAVKCDTPPFGYIGARSQHAGFDVEIARWFARFAFGKSNRVTFTCVTTPAREPALTTGRNDLVIATFTYNTDRDTRIDFSRGYYKGTGRLLVPNNSSIRSVADLAGKTVVTTSGSVYDRWVKNCFKDTKLLVTDSFTNAVTALKDGRADTLDVGRHRGPRHRRDRSRLQAHDRPVPVAAVRHRDQAGEHRYEGMGQLPAQPDEEARSLLPDSQEHGPTCSGRPVLEEHPEAEADVRLQQGRYHDRVPVATPQQNQGAAAPRAAAPDPSR